MWWFSSCFTQYETWKGKDVSPIFFNRKWCGHQNFFPGPHLQTLVSLFLTPTPNLLVLASCLLWRGTTKQACQKIRCNHIVSIQGNTENEMRGANGFNTPFQHRASFSKFKKIFSYKTFDPRFRLTIFIWVPRQIFLLLTLTMLIWKRREVWKFIKDFTVKNHSGWNSTPSVVYHGQIPYKFSNF